MANTSEKIIAITKDIIANFGLKAASAGFIAKNGGFSKASIFYYYDNVDELLECVLKDCIVCLDNILDKNWCDYENFSDYLYLSLQNLITNEKKALNLKVLFSFAHDRYYFDDEKNSVRNMLVENVRLDLMSALEFFYPDSNIENSEYLISLLMTSFYGVGIFLSLDKRSDMLLHDWKMQCDLVDNYLKNVNL